MKTLNLFGYLSLFLLSFDVLALTVRVGNGGTNSMMCHAVFGVSSGQIVDLDVVRSLASSKLGQQFSGYTLIGFRQGLGADFTGRRNMYCQSSYTPNVSCNPPNEIDPNTGICGDAQPPSCPDGQIYNPVTGQCEPDTDEGFCQSDEYNELLFEAEQSCAAQFPNHHAYVTPSCTDSQNYSFTCNQGAPRGDGDNGDGDNGGGDNGGGDNGNGGGDNGNGGGDNGDGNTDPDNSGQIVQAINDASDSITANQSDILSATQAIDNTLKTTIKDAISNSTNDLQETNQTGFDGVIGSQEQIEQAVNALTAQNSQDAANLQSDLRRVKDSVDGLTGSVTASECQSFTCTGVEAICYLAKKRWLDECAQQNIDGDFTDEGNSLQSALGQYANDSKDEKGAYKGVYSEAPKSVDALLNTFDESNGLSFESGCPSPVTYDTGIGTFAIDFSPFCDLAIFVRALLLTTVSYLVVMLFAKYL